MALDLDLDLDLVLLHLDPNLDHFHSKGMTGGS